MSLVQYPEMSHRRFPAVSRAWSRLAMSRSKAYRSKSRSSNTASTRGEHRIGGQGLQARREWNSRFERNEAQDLSRLDNRRRCWARAPRPLQMPRGATDPTARR